MLGVTATIQVGGQPTELAVDPDGTKVYVVNFAGDTLAVIDTASNTLTSIVAITPQIDDSQHMVMHPNGDRLYVSRGGAVSVVDVTSATVIADIALPAVMAFLAIHPNGSKLYVGNGDLDGTNGALLVIDTATHTVVDTVSVGGAPYVPAVSPDGARLYAAI
jgi:YVTN family beta-propeller protein